LPISDASLCDRVALNGAFTIYIFIGETPGPTISPTEYLVQPTLVGANHIFADPVEACDNCGQQEEQGQLITNTAQITPMLLDYIQIGELQDLTPASVKTSLVERLKWRLVTICP
jgi:hypothetical protein